MNFRAIMRHYWPFLVQYKWSQAILFSSYGLGKLIDIVVVPIIFKLIIDTVSAPPADPASVLFQLLWYLGLAFLFLNIIFRVGDYFMIYSQSKILEQLSNYTLEKLQNHSYSFFSNSFSGGLVAKTKRFVSAFEELHDQAVYGLWFGGISLLSSTVVLLYYSPIIGAIFFLWLLTYMVMIWYLIKIQIPKGIRNAEADTKVTAHYSDIITNFFTVMMFGSKRIEQAAFQVVTKDQQQKRWVSWMQEGFWSTMWQGININTFTLLFMIGAVWLWLSGEITAGTIVLVQIYAIKSFDVVWNLSKQSIRIFVALTDANEMVEILDRAVDVKDPIKPERVAMPRGQITFSDVHFTYEGEANVFAGLNLHIPAGQKVALVGHSGAGKTTITKLLLRFRDIESGTITIDGQNIAAVRQDELRRKIAYVPQEPLLFHRSLRDNIAYAKPSASLAEIQTVAEKAHAHEFISQLPNGYDTLVGERGVKLSGGERQRVAIARAMLKDAPIVMLDEATSALDSISEQKIQTALWKLIQGRTTLVIAHRLSTIQKMDRIIVFAAGQVVEDGTHDELLYHGKVYAKLWQSQVGGYIAD